jgi:hypothetical protein
VKRNISQPELMAEKEKHEDWLSQQQGVTGIGIGLDGGGRVCIKIYSNHMPPQTEQAIRSRLTDLPIDIEETGEFQAF